MRTFRRSPRTYVAVFFVLAGLAVLAWSTWEIVGTTLAVRGDVKNEVSEWASSHDLADREADESDVIRLDDSIPWITSITMREPKIQQPDTNGIIGVLHVPLWGEDYAAPIKVGAVDAVLDTGRLGQYSSTQLPGEVGNSAIAGHRLTRGNPFLHIDKLKPGDPIVVETSEAWLVFQVSRENEIVPPTQVDVLEPVPGEPGVEPTERILTLQSCWPLNTSSDRIIVYAELSHWSARDKGYPPEIAEMKQADTIRVNRVR